MKKLLPTAAFSLFALAGQAQLTITDSLTIGSITTLLEGIGVTVSNVTVNCPERAMGHFVGTSSSRRPASAFDTERSMRRAANGSLARLSDSTAALSDR